MEQSSAHWLKRFKRLGAVYVLGCALVVALLVAFGVRELQIMTYGRMIASGLNGIGVASLDRGSGVSDPAVRSVFLRNFEALVAQGAFHCITLVTPAGDVIASTGPCPLLDEGQRSVARVIDENTIATSIGSGEQRELLVVAPLRTAPEEEPYAAVIAARPYSLVQASLVGTSVAIVATIMLGAAAAYAMLRALIRRAEREIDEQAQLVEAMDERLASSLQDAEEQTVGTLKALVAAVDAKDSYTARHSLNVADYACAIAAAMGHDDDLLKLERAGLLHDVGKIGVPEVILSKPAALSDVEFATVKEHSAAGAGIVTAIPALRDVVPVIRHHHERVDGSGYPDGLAGDEIPLLARILAVADAFDAMTTERPYQRAMDTSTALATLIAHGGTQFDPRVVDAFVNGVMKGQIRVRAHAA